MTPLFKKATVATVIALSFGVSTQALARTNSYDFGVVSDWAATTTSVNAGVGFSDLFTFSLTQIYDAAVGSQSLVVNGNTGVMLTSLSLYIGSFANTASLSSAALLGTVATGAYVPPAYNLAQSFEGLHAGTTYTLLATGSNIGEIRSGYTTQIQLAPIPEPQTYALLLAGLGLMGLVARRKTRMASPPEMRGTAVMAA